MVRDHLKNSSWEFVPGYGVLWLEILLGIDEAPAEAPDEVLGQAITGLGQIDEREELFAGELFDDTLELELKEPRKEETGGVAGE